MDEAESNAPQQAIVLTIRPSSGSTFTTAISTDSTVLQLKEKLATADLPAASIRLVYSGRVLKDDDQLSVYSIKEGHTLHMVKSATNRANEQAVQTVRPNANSNAAGPEGFDEQEFWRKREPFWRRVGIRQTADTGQTHSFQSHDDFVQYVTRQTRQHQQGHISTQTDKQDAGQPNNPSRKC